MNPFTQLENVSIIEGRLCDRFLSLQDRDELFTKMMFLTKKQLGERHGKPAPLCFRMIDLHYKYSQK
jgi:hypothetical protein